MDFKVQSVAAKPELSEEIGPRLYKMRWVVLFFFGMSELCNVFLYSTFTPIANDVRQMFDKSAVIITLSASLYLLMHPLFTFPASYMILNKGIAYSIRVGIIATIVGASIRCLSVSYSFYWILLGQTLSGIGRPFILNAQANISQNWFPLSQRTLMMTILNFIVTISGIVGTVVPSTIYSGYHAKDEIYIDGFPEGFKKLGNLLYLETILCAIFLIPAIFIIRSKPPSPPAPVSIKLVSVDFKDSVMALFKDKKFITLFLAFSFFQGSFKGFSVAIPFIVLPFGLDHGDISLLVCMPIVGGLFSSMAAPALYRKLKGYKIIILGCITGTMCCFFLLYYALMLDNRAVQAVVVSFIGVFMIPAFPFILEWGCKQTYPVNDSFCIGIMYAGATFFSSFVGELLTIITKGQHADKWSSFFGIVTVIGLQVIAALLILANNEIKHKTLLHLHQSFHSAKPIHAGTVFDNSDIFGNFPNHCPEGDPEILFDYQLDDEKSEDQEKRGSLLGSQVADYQN